MANDLNHERDGQDSALDPWLRLRPDAELIVQDWLLHGCAHFGRQRERKDADLGRFSSVLALVIANTLRAGHQPVFNRVHYGRQHSDYSGDTIYHPAWLGTKNLKSAVDALAEREHLSTKLGHRGKDFGPGKQSAFSPTEGFLGELLRRGVTLECVERDDQGPVLRLKDDEKHLVPYDPSLPPVSGWIENLREFNAYLGNQKLGLAIPPDLKKEFFAQFDQGADRRPRPDSQNVGLYRVFNKRQWEQNGRFYGGWWQLIPSRWRPFITINGEGTTERDFSGFLTRAAYHRDGIEYAVDDPYEIPEIRQVSDAEGLDWAKVRKSLKLMHNTLLNASATDKINHIPNLTLPKGWTRARVYEIIANHHDPIREHFRKGEGLELMNLESRICEDVMMNGLKENIPVLPIHDSFLVPDRASEWLEATMKDCYRRQFSFDPKIH